MALTDLMLKAKVNMTFARDPRVSALEINVSVEDGVVTLTGDMDSQEKCQAAEEDARSVDGVKAVRNEMTCGLTKIATTATEVVQRFLAKLEEQWNALPDKTALTQADYLRWALWMVTKFHIPPNVEGENIDTLEIATVERALEQIGGYTDIPKALLALEMLRQSEAIEEMGAPETENPDLITSPIAESDAMPVTAGQHTPREAEGVRG
ncbi:MAG TPA: BON domain-containing protein [Chthonomonadaceae bacterium]|nr:BON domain-containing protein [Chthonomonadaceae bacterium]